MISILIPTYNYDITTLVHEIYNQALINVVFEILVYDDCSLSNLNKKNQSINRLKYCVFKELKQNIGRIAIRKLLASDAKYEYLLFIDADVLPKLKNFISNYFSAIQTKNDVIFGGITYELTPPKKDYLLRWKYGISREEVDATVRNKKPYKIAISGNFIIKSKIFKSIYGQINETGYGLDAYFGALLKTHNIKVKHINNEVIHLGIEKSITYINKMEEAALTLLKLYEQGKMNKNDNDLLSLFLNLKHYKLIGLFSFFYKIFRQILKQNLTSKYPIVYFLQAYRILYMCNAYLK